ncbi:spore protease YyaC [Petroclostridium sp. X23]|jgi:putative sporulation protein YyaC|uniref:spore protease YyaC n=1 Tax=Petroclostridium sp. X23 TaxID=3045146 RepID=UPI0024AE739E|nr:spore protease YyaC [Petroclostridium sp. X23]WHH57361.1 spore protease YyaC [Petroclostridium sp. X23]
MINAQQDTKYIDVNKISAFREFTSAITTLLDDHTLPDYDNIIIVCIGTDRSTGDSLGPLVGYKLSTLRYDNVHILGTLDQPVHAKNLEENYNYIKENYRNALIIAIDACLGKMNHIGYVTITKGPLKPGAGVNKVLPEIGHISIAGIVNFSGYLDFLVLQNTRLSVVMKMTDLITSGLKYVLWKKYHPRVTNIQLNTSPQLQTQLQS